jgi:hypothetical protein
MLFDAITLARTVEAFYLSNQSTSFVLVSFAPPIDSVVQFRLKRKGSYSETLGDVLSRVTLYTSTCIKMSYTINGKQHTRIAVGPSHKTSALKDIYDRQHKEYCYGI